MQLFEMKVVILFAAMLFISIAEVIGIDDTNTKPNLCTIPKCTENEDLVQGHFGCGYCRPKRRK